MVTPYFSPIRAVRMAQEQREQVEAPRREDAEVPVHRQDGIVWPKGGGHADGNGFLPDSGEPLRQSPLSKQNQHLLLDHPREDEGAIQCEATLRSGPGRLG